MRNRGNRTVLAYLLSPLLVAAVTVELTLIQEMVRRLDGVFPRPFSIFFVLAVAIATFMGGRGPGFLTLALSAVSYVMFLTEPHFSWKILYSRDWVEIIAMLAVGGVLTIAIEMARRSRLRAEEVGARLRTVMDTAPAGVLTVTPLGWLEYANQEAERIFGQPFHPVPMTKWERYGIHDTTGRPLPAEETALIRVMQGNNPVLREEWEILRPDGERVWVVCDTSRVADEAGRLLGAMTVFTDETKRKHAEAERAALLAQTQARAEREAFINRIGQRQRASLDPEMIQTTAIEALGKALHADRCFYTLYDFAEGAIRVDHDFHTEGLPSLTGEYRIAALGYDPEALFPVDTPLVVSDVERESRLPPQYISRLRTARLRAIVTVPLWSDGRLVASLTVGMAHAPREWTDEEIGFVAAVAAQTHSTIESSRLLARERNIAARLQQALTPDIPRSAPGLDIAGFYQAALAEANVGGDFYDVFAIDADRTAVVLGDLSGKGLAAASQVAIVRNMLRLALYRDAPLADAIGELNRITARHDLITGFATLFVAVYDAASATLDYVSCGSESGLLRRVSGQIEELQATGPVFGVFAEASYETRQAILAPGDTLALFTDGLSEAGRRRHDFLDVAGLASLLRACGADALTRSDPARTVVDSLIDGVVVHTQGQAHDDMCLLVLVAAPDAKYPL